MTRLGKVSINNGHALDLWFEVEESRESTEVSPDTIVSYTEDDKVGTRSTTVATGEQVTLRPIVSYSPNNESISFNFSSDNPTEIDVSPNGDVVFQVEPESTASANITITATSGEASCSRVYSVTLTLSGADVVEVIEGGVSGSARKALSDPLDNALVGADLATQQSIYSSQDHATSSYVRNTSFFLPELVEAMTCASPWNSAGANTRAGTALTKRHAVLANHYKYGVGTVVRFIASDNTVIERTVKQAARIFKGGVGTDVWMVLFDSDLPASITPCKVFPSDFEVYLPAGAADNSYAATDIPLLSLDQQEKGICLDFLAESWSSNTPIVSYGMPTLPNRSTFFEAIISGDSGNPIFAVIGTEVWLLSTFHGPGAGPFYSKLITELNAMIVELDTLQGINTGYTVTEGDLSSYTTY
jgi:hypothetical protein